MDCKENNDFNQIDQDTESELDDKEILHLAGPGESLEDALHAELSETMIEPFQGVFRTEGLEKNAKQKVVKLALVEAMQRTFEEKMPVAWRANEDSLYIYVSSERCYISFNPQHLSRMLLSIASQAHANVRKELKQRPAMPTPAELTRAFAANIGPTVDGQRQINQWETMSFRNCFISLNDRIVSNDPLPPEVFHTQTLKVDFGDGNEPPEIWMRFCESIGYGTPEMRAALEDILFYLVSPSIERHEAFFLLGSGRNGKSVLLNFLRKVIGERFVGAASLEQIQKNFGLEPLLNKKLSLSSESGASDFVESKTFKAIVSGDTVQVDRKNVRAITVTFPLKLAFALNEAPVIVDKSDGMYARVRVLHFNRIIPPEERVDRYEDRLFEYGSEIVTWWVRSHYKRHDGYKPKFSLPPIFEEWKKELFITGTDAVEAFIATRLEEASGERVAFQDVHKEYKIFIHTQKWAGSGGVSGMGSQTFGRRLVSTYRRMHDGRELVSKASNGVRYYYGVKLRPFEVQAFGGK